ncbi:MAG: efflux RND transporter permease subunit [Planktomarina sp.]|nr:efflux RND transporter permease subunit [Planktomarina sp.]|tara:strand:+ start:375 stop:3557 length:3183 start_codon:yes stop_codon:yes gene_type:complete
MNSIIKWMAEHPVAANLITVFVIAVGILSVTQMPQKTFPEFSLDAVSVSVSYPGASPLEIQDSIVRPIEDQLSGVDGIDSVTASISEGRGGVVVSFLRGENIAKKLDEIKTEIDRIRVFPDDADEPSVEQASNNSRVLEIALHGDASEAVLKEEAHRLKEELTSLPAISFVEIVNTREYEVSIELSRDMLRAYGITISEVAQIISQSSLELPGGSIKTNTVAIPIRTTGRNYTQSDFENIIIRTSPDGGRVYLRDIAKVVDGFQDTDLSTNFNGDPSVSVNVFRVGDEQVLTIVEEAINHLDLKFRPTLEDGINVTVWQNEATNLQDRIDLLVNNAAIGLVLVVLCLALFLDIRLAFWSAFGIGISFTATFIIMSSLGMSINMISLFGFILAIGIVVDNAIVVSENIYTNSEKGMPAMQAAVKGTQRIAIPVVFSALTTIVAFWPLTQLPGVLGKFLTDIPIVVMVVLSLSLVQALIILPRNLSKLDVSPSYSPNLVFKALNLVRSVVDTGLQWFVRVPLDAVLRFTTNGFAILIPIAFAISLMMMTVGLLAFGYVKFNFFPSIDGDFVTASIEMNDGTTFDMTQKVAEDVRLAALKAGSLIQNGLPQSAPSVIVGINVVVGRGVAAGGPGGGTAANGATIANVVVQITDPTQRSWESSEFEAVWRNAIGPIASVKTLSVSAELIGAGAAVAIEMSLPDGDDISPVVADLRENLRKIPGLFSLQDDNSAGRLEFRLALREEARLYGVTLSDLANQTRAGFFGLEATSVQRGADNVSVIVRYPANERDSLSDLLSTWITTPSGDQIPLSTVAKIEEGQAPAQILRRDGRQVTTLTADLDTAISTSSEVKVLIETDLIPKLKAKYNNLILTSGGEQREQADAQAALSQALGIALFIIFALLALVFRSYIQPIVVMSAIPLGLIGAVSGHYIMGIPLTILSIFGIIGLAGVVINNSLVMVDVYNEHIANNMVVREAVILGTKQRFRPILLTSLTTFLGVYPLIMETSLQAQFLIPLAVSIGYGVLFGTVIIVLTVPALFMAQHYVALAFKVVISTLFTLPKKI